MYNDSLDGGECAAHKVCLNRQKLPLLSRIRTFGNHLALSSLGSAFSGSLSVFQDDHKTELRFSDHESARTPTGYDPEDLDPFAAHLGPNRLPLNVIETSTPTATRSNSPVQLNRLSDVGKRIFTTAFTRPRAGSHAKRSGKDNNTERIHLAFAGSIRNTHAVNSHRKKHASHHFVDEFAPLTLSTPPLTPDNYSEQGFLSPVLFEDNDAVSEWNVRPFDQVQDEDEIDEIMETAHARDRSIEIKEGKKPDRSFDQDTVAAQTARGLEDDEEWFGLEYTLELSSRERSPSDTKPSSVGEHSKVCLLPVPLYVFVKPSSLYRAYIDVLSSNSDFSIEQSRQSWAVLHRGMIHPFFEDEDYHQWKNWHRYLERQDLRRRHRRGFEFKARSKHLAWFYVDEMKIRKVMFWQKEVYGVVARDVKDRLDLVMEQRPDPYVPTQKHNFGWFLKRSRSVGCIRELRTLPVHGYDSTLADIAIDSSTDGTSGLDTDDSFYDASL